MGWLGLKRRPGRDKDEEELLEPQPAMPLAPVLNLLVPDIAGVTSFRLRQFFDVEEAADYIQSLPSISGLHAFWGLHEPPPGHQEGEGTGEAMVLIRSAEESETVYVVSFVDLDSALSFARFEVKRGMSLALLLIYWAEIVEVEAGEHGIRLSPDAPPLPGFGSRRFGEEHWAQAAAEAAPVVPAAAAGPVAVAQALDVNAGTEEPEPAVIEEPAAEAIKAPEPELSWEKETSETFEKETEAEAVKAPEPELSWETETSETFEEETEAEAAKAPEPELSWETETSQTFEKETEEEFEQFVAEQEELRATAEPAPEVEAPAEIEEQVPEPEAVSIVDPQPVAAEPGPVAEPEAATPTQEEMDIEREAIAFLRASANGKNSAAAWEVPAEEPVEAAPAPRVEVEEIAAPEPEPAAEPQAVAAPAEAQAPEDVPAAVGPVTVQLSVPVHSEGESDDGLTEDLVEEVEKILKVKRWDKRESPFKGFESPPGRF